MTFLKESPQTTEWKGPMVHLWEHAGLRYYTPGTRLLHPHPPPPPLPPAAAAAGLT